MRKYWIGYEHREAMLFLFYSAEKSLSFDPRMRHTVWGVICNLTYLFANAYGVSQTSVQRYLSLKSRKDRIMWVPDFNSGSTPWLMTNNNGICISFYNQNNVMRFFHGSCVALCTLNSFSPFEKFTSKLGINLFTGQMSSSKNKKNNNIVLVKWQNFFSFFSKAG